jgi:hypothetical protein
VALVSLCVAILGLYFSWLAPFRPLITVGGPVFQFGVMAPSNAAAANANTAEFDPQKSRVLGGILLPILFTHEGGRPGTISDVMLRVSRRGNADNWLFEPRLFVDEHAFLTSFDPQAALKWIEASFSPIALGRAQQVKRFILFQGNDNDHFPGGRLRISHYSLDVLVRINDSPTYQSREKIEVDFSDEVLATLDVGKYAPGPLSVISARRRLR